MFLALSRADFWLPRGREEVKGSTVPFVSPLNYSTFSSVVRLVSPTPGTSTIFIFSPPAIVVRELKRGRS
jgi:hypothetical protein